jgi:orotate phosphoribosyltransferase
MSAETIDIGRRVAPLLITAGAVQVSRQQPFILAGGWASPVYIDCRVLIGDLSTRHAITELTAQYMATVLPGGFDAIAGAETAGIPFATLLAEQSNVALRYVRKRPLGIGRNAQVEGGAVEGLRVLLIDDLTTDGTSKLAFVRGLRSAGAVVEHALVVFFNNAFPGAIERLNENGVALHALATWADILLKDSGLATEDRATIENFLGDPVTWSSRNGGLIARAPVPLTRAHPDWKE